MANSLFSNERFVAFLAFVFQTSPRNNHQQHTATPIVKMSSKTGEAPKQKKKKKGKSKSLIAKLTAKLLQDRGRHCFNEWFSDDEIMSFREGSAQLQTEPLFVRYQEKMEAALEDFCADEGLRDPAEIIDALRECREEGGEGEWKKLDKMIDTMTKKEDFFVMMMKKADRTHAKREGGGGKTGGGGGGGGGGGAGSKSSKK
jgi:hypothetical protein